MTMVIAMMGQKGGGGKSTVAVCLAAEAIARGRAVLLVDADPQGTCRTWGAVGAELKTKAPKIIAADESMHLPGKLDQEIQAFDLVIIDCPGRQDEIQRSALMVADLAVLPCGPSAPDVWALKASVELIDAARRLRPQLGACVVITRVQGRTALGKGARGVLTDSGLPVLKAELGFRIAYQEALAAGQGTTTYAPRDPAAGEIHALLDELLAMEKRHVKEKARPRSPKAARAR